MTVKTPHTRNINLSIQSVISGHYNDDGDHHEVDDNIIDEGDDNDDSEDGDDDNKDGADYGKGGSGDDDDDNDKGEFPNEGER
ncbi:hypothetical protein PoB_002460500 [Plakobranchus ocellatus]|uniref:Uncharacterized protein n=1 Tax=Plakobranchus ocellatus TaxID=259542 RepID=A0AAV3ZSL8_9GAST|nr:hypothetical protein PoB_002460500 [Plakobranchus ocellatus]